MWLCSFLLSSVLLGRCFGLQDFGSWAHERIQLADTSIHFRYSQGGKPPLLLIHGSPQHSLTWYKLGPLLAENYTVIAPDNRGTGESSLSSTDNYTAPAAAEDHLAILNFLKINTAVILAHDKGVGLATSLAREYPERVERLIISEYPLPGFGYSTEVTSPSLYNNWQLAFFAVPDAAEFFIRGRVKEMLAWYFYHSSYSGNSVISNDLLESYTRSLSKPGFLHAMLKYFSSAFFDADYFTGIIKAKGRLSMPVLALGGEASFGTESALQTAFEGVASNLTVAVVPKAGHWLADENPSWFATQALQFFASSEARPALDLSALEDMTTMFGSDGRGNNVTPGTENSTF